MILKPGSKLGKRKTPNLWKWGTRHRRVVKRNSPKNMGEGSARVTALQQAPLSLGQGLGLQEKNAIDSNPMHLVTWKTVLRDGSDNNNYVKIKKLGKKNLKWLYTPGNKKIHKKKSHSTPLGSPVNNTSIVIIM